MQAVLWRIRDDKAAAERAERIRNALVDRLYNRVYRVISRREIADLWATAQWKELGGLKPVDSAKTRKRWLGVLRPWRSSPPTSGSVGGGEAFRVIATATIHLTNNRLPIVATKYSCKRAIGLRWYGVQPLGDPNEAPNEGSPRDQHIDVIRC